MAITDTASSRSLLHSAWVVGFMTLLSRITGLLVNRMIASSLGISGISDAYKVAYLVPNMLRRLAAEGVMTAAFQPTLSDVHEKRGEAEARSFVAAFIGSFGTIMLAVCIVGVLLMTPITGFMMLGKLAPDASFATQLGILWDVLLGKSDFPSSVTLSASLGRIMFSYLLLISTMSVLAAVLNRYERRDFYALTASTSTVGNLVFLGSSWIVFYFMAQSCGERAAIVFACAMLLHGLVQIFMLLPTFKRMGFNFGWVAKFNNPDVKLALKRMLPGIIAGGIHPINITVSQSLASQLNPGSQTVLSHSNTLGEVVLGLFAVSMATVSLSRMGNLASKGDLDGVSSSLGEALRGTALLAIPGSIGMAILATPIVATVFRAGAFDASAVEWTAKTLPYQAIGLIFIASSRISTSALNAMKDYRGPAMAALVSFIFNVVFSLMLMGPMGTSGMALANSLAAVAALGFYIWRLKFTLGRIPLKGVAEGWLKMIAAAVLMGVVAWYGSQFLGIHDPYSFKGAFQTAIRLIPLIGLCSALYFGFALAFRIPEAESITGSIMRKFSR